MVNLLNIVKNNKIYVSMTENNLVLILSCSIRKFISKVNSFVAPIKHFNLSNTVVSYCYIITNLRINYIKYYGLYHIVVIYLLALLLNMYQQVSFTAECEGIPELQRAVDEFYRQQNDKYEKKMLIIKSLEEKVNKHAEETARKHLEEVARQYIKEKNVNSQMLPMDRLLMQCAVNEKKDSQLITELNITIENYNKMYYQAKLIIMDIAKAQKRLLDANNEIELDNMRPTEELSRELRRIMEYNPKLIQAIKANNLISPEMLEILKEVKKLAIDGNLVAQHFYALIYHDLSCALEPYADSSAKYGDVLNDLKEIISNKVPLQI